MFKTKIYAAAIFAAAFCATPAMAQSEDDIFLPNKNLEPGRKVRKTVTQPTVTYCVQVLSKTHREDWHVKEFEDLGTGIFLDESEVAGRYIVRYMISPSDNTNIQEAQTILEKVRHKFPDAFIVMKKNGKRIN